MAIAAERTFIFLDSNIPMKNLFVLCLLFLLAGSFFANAEDAKTKSKVLYRYINEQGSKVIGQTIPPQYVRAGYEIVAVNGEVIKVVPAAPSDADAERVAKEKKIAKIQERIDLQLRRTYSNANEIDAAKARFLHDSRNNINILQANLLSVNAQLKQQENHAASLERNGQKVPDEVINNIATLQNEAKDAIAQIKQREIEVQEASDKFDADKKRFMEISKANSK